MKILGAYIKLYIYPIMLGMFCVFCEAICDLLQPTMMSKIIDDGVKNGSVETVIKYGGIMLLISLVGMFFAGSRNILAATISQKFGAKIRLDAFSKVLKFSMESADNLDNGAIITRLTNDTSQLVQFVNGMMRIFLKAPLTCVGAIFLAIMLSFKLSIIMFIGIVLVTTFILLSMKLSYKRFKKVQEALDSMNVYTQEFLSGIRLVKSFGRYDHEQQEFTKINEDLSKKSISSSLIIIIFSPLMTLVINVSIIAIFMIGSYLFSYGEIEVGKIAAFISYMTQILGSLIMITNIFNTFVRTKASSERIEQILNSPEDFVKENVNTEKKVNTSHLKFDDVTFAYPTSNGKSVLKNLSFSLEKGETLAIIGPTGAGKTTLIWLMLRFYDVNNGGIYFEGKNIKEYDVKKLRDLFAVAPQNSMLFSGTIFDNISGGKAGVTKKDVDNAMYIASANTFINKMADGYNSILGQSGVNVSGGQKQRISIARAVLKNAPVLVLDDSTSALDTVTESAVKSRIKEQNNTTIIITQRIGTAKNADKILVLENGDTKGYGTHNELINDCLIYQEIYKSQIGKDI